ncbi:ShlB/FhaC/HecB family hemolysin secretion/activation protein [Glaciimonas immobilis]|uniref:Hemolysin activation/secretion protein n=1 Tax=Glaciimonas immobilis TaxID=728004 RepID=A0A840RK02_9BURK|nr:ShlB/FhaC/HecB family hemolysin secretion/activation protein [Glaciimonas immobilis]KAF3999093.1 ShlB/FhaC/HecB family hemolysin secretion/activation protein [Glaciimonas immobilis]MBB5198527.1 hemolysin activation/secretion protein [Glaciimonas immobilis]
MHKNIYLAHRPQSLVVLAHTVTLLSLLAGVFSSANSQTVQTPASEELRQRSQAEAAERARQLHAPNIALPIPAVTVSVEDVNSLTLPVESPCFKIHQFVLAVPLQISPAVRIAGASNLAFDPFRFAQDFLHQYSGKCIGQQGMNLVVQRLTNRIMQKGYSTTRVGIPEQDLSTGVLTLTLVPGVIHTIRFADAALHGTPRNAFPTGAGQLLNLRDLEQGLEQLKRVPNQDVSMQIVPADALGESDVMLEVKRTKPYTLSANFDDSGARGTGHYQGGLNLGVNNMLGFSDIFNLGMSSDTDHQGNNRGTGGHSVYYAVPMGYWNYALSASDYTYHQKIAGNNEDYISSGKSKNLEFKVAQQFQRNASQKNSWQLKVGKRWSNTLIDDVEIGVQKRNTSFVELGWVHTHYLGNAQLDVTLANRWGSSAFGGMGNPEARPSDYPTFTYTLQTIDATLAVPFQIASQPLSYVATFRGQNTRSQLYTTDQFSIGGRYTVRGFDGELTLTAERGFYLRNELNLPIARSAQAAYIAVDLGKVYGPSVQYLVGDTLAGTAVGVRGGYQGFTYDLFAGWSLYKPAQFKTARPAFGFNLTYQY